MFGRICLFLSGVFIGFWIKNFLTPIIVVNQIVSIEEGSVYNNYLRLKYPDSDKIYNLKCDKNKLAQWGFVEGDYIILSITPLSIEIVGRAEEAEHVNF